MSDNDPRDDGFEDSSRRAEESYTDGGAGGGAGGHQNGGQDGHGVPGDAPARTGRVTVDRSAYYGLVVTAIVGIAIGAFFAGYFVAHTANSPEYVTVSQLQDLLSGDRPAGTAAGGTAATAGRVLVVSQDDDPVMGDPDAPVTMVEFSDFECPFCARFHQQTLPRIVSEYVETGHLNIVYRDFPIDSIHPNARIAHIAAECADEQGAFWPYHDILFERQSEWGGLGPGDEAASGMMRYAAALSLDADAFASCLGDPAIGAEIDADRAQGSVYGVSGTPAFFIGNDRTGYEMVSGAKPFESFAQVIDRKVGGA